MPSRDHYDTIIVGAGLAGCALGCLLADAGERVLVVERQDLDAKRKLCGGLVTLPAYELLIEAMGSEAASLPWSDMETYEVRSGDHGITGDGRGLRSIPRIDLDRFMTRCLRESDADLMEGTRIDAIDIEGHELGIAGVSCSWERLIGADGASSQVRRALTGRNQRLAVAAESFVAPTDAPVLMEAMEGLYGYAYVIPNARGSVLGVASMVARNDLRNAFTARFGSAATASMRTGVLPTGDDAHLGSGDVFLAGDAAGLAAPIAGEGIRYALASALALAAHPDQASYRRMLAPYLRRLASERAASKVIYNEKMRRIIFERCDRSKMAHRLIEAFSGYILS